MIAPMWPHDPGGWFALVLLALLASTELQTAWAMYRRSVFIDRLGAAFIAFDVLIGVIWVYFVAAMLWPMIVGSHTLLLILRAATLVAVLWKRLELYRSTPPRRERDA